VTARAATDRARIAGSRYDTWLLGSEPSSRPRPGE
jgi:hypothetical protein